LDCLTLEDGADISSRNASYKLPIYVAKQPRRAKISFTPWWKPGITQNHGIFK